MALLPRTEAALAELAANSKFGPGMHTEQHLRTAVFGSPIGSVDFDPERHSPSDIMAFSFGEEVTGMPQVEQVLPNRPLGLNVILDYIQTRDAPKITKLKQRVADEVANAAERALPSVTDRAYTFQLGDSPQGMPDFGERIGSDTPEHRIRSVEEICRSGLTIIISDFRHLSFDERADINQFPAVAVKVSHPAELSFPENSGVIAIGSGVEVNTDKPEQVARMNSMLAGRHLAIIEGLQHANMSVAEAVYNPGLSYGFDAGSVDTSLSAAITAYGNR